MPPPTFWRKLWRRIEPDALSWFTEAFGYLKIFSLLLLAHLIFRFLKLIGIEWSFVDDMLEMDHAAIKLVFGMFLISIVRNAFVSFFLKN